MFFRIFNRSIVLGLVALLLALPLTSHAGGVLPDSLDYSFKLYSGQAAFDTPMPVAFDETTYWATSGGGTSSPMQQYDALTGDVLSQDVPGIDFRSTFVDAGGTIYASGYNDNQIYQLVAPGKLTSVLTLLDVLPESQAPVILSPDGTQYASRIGNTINLWSAVDGGWQSALTLADYGSVSGEDSMGTGQTDLNLAAFGSYYLTYLEGSDMVYAWDSKGNRVGDLQLRNNASASAYSFSYSNGYIFTNDSGQYRGFALSSGSSLSSSAAAPEPGTLALGVLGLIGLALRRRRK